MYRYYLLLFTLFVGSISMFAQVSFEATTDAKQVIENGYFQVTYTLNNAQGNDFQAPPFKNFKVLSGPSRSMSTTIINGQTSQTLAYSYSLQPRKTGKFKILPASITVNGRRIRSNNLEIDVIKASSASKIATEEQQLFVRAEIDTNLVYVGQQLVVNYKLYTTVNIENYDIAYEPEYQGFFARDIRRFDSRVVREVVDGVQYTTKILKRISLFPQQTGLQTIESMTVRLGVVVGNKRPNSFFFSNQIKPVNVQTNPLEINVKSLPTPIPPSFSGAVGKYAMNSFINKNNLTTDDALSIKLTIQGNGDIKRLQAPSIDFPNNFDVYDPKIIEERFEETGGLLKGQKILEYLAIPSKSGRYELKPSFTYFDTDSAKFITLLPNIFKLTVRQGQATANNLRPNSSSTEQKDIRYIKTQSTFHRKSQPFPKSSLFYGLLFFPFLVLGGTLIYKQVLNNSSRIDIVKLRSKRAEKVATQKLVKAKEYMLTNKSKAFYDEISRASLGYVCDKLNIPLSELTKDNVQQRLQSLKVSEPNITAFMDILKTTEMALFAGMDNSAAMQDTYQKTAKVISAIEVELDKF